MNNALFEQTSDGLKLDYIIACSEMTINQQFDDRRLLLSVLSEDTMILENSNLVPLNEGLISTVIEFIKKLIDSVARVIDRFVADIRKVIGMDGKFLANNKEIITTGLKQIERNDTIERYRDYDRAFEEFEKKDGGELVFNKSNVNFDTIRQNVDKWQTAVDYVNSELPNLVDGGYDKNEQTSLKNKIINHFAGEPHDVKDAEITAPSTKNQQRFVKMYDFCYKGYGAVLDSIKLDKEKINKLNDIVSEELEKIKRQSESNAPVPTENEAAPAQTEKPQESTLESTLEYYFLEDNNPAVGDNMKGNDNGPAKITHDDSKDNNANQNDKGNENNDNDEKKNVDTNTKLANAIQSFYNANMAVMSAKMRLCMDVYKQSMRIMRWYVSRVGGKSEEQDEKDKNTDTKIPDLK